MPEGIFEKAFTKRQNRRHDRCDSLLIKDHVIQDNEISRKQQGCVSLTYGFVKTFVKENL